MLKRICLIFLSAAIICLYTPAFAADSTSSTAALRMKPLINKLNALTAGDIQAGISKYSDVKKHWAGNYIGRLTRLEVIGGGTGGKFNPDGDMSAAGFIKMVALSLGYKIIQGTGKIPWYNPYIEQAKKDKLIDSGDFTDYTKAITREQASKILYRAAMLFHDDVKDQGYMGVMRCRVKDYAQIGDRYKDFMIKSYILGYFTLGSTAVSNPKGKFTRAQACTVVMRLLDIKERGEFTVKGNEYYTGTDGKRYYPIWSMDPVNAINTVERSLGKSTGYIVKPSSGMGGADYVGYESEDESISNPVMGMDFTMGIYTDNSSVHTNWPYNLTMIDMKIIKEKHLEFIKALLKVCFEEKYSDSFNELKKVLETTGKRVDKEIKINDRYMSIHGENGVIQIDITCKGGLTAKQFLEKYP